MDRVVREHPEGSQSLDLEVTCPEEMARVIEGEDFQSERRKGKP